MTALDAAALERASAPAVELLGLRTVRDSGSGSAVTGFDAFGRVYVTAAVAEFQRRSRSDAVTLTVEQSADGESWEAAATLEFTADGIQFATIDAPADQLRVSWTFAGLLRSCRIVGVKATAGSLDSASSPGGSNALQLLGPMTVPFDDPGVNSTYTVLRTLTAGTAIVRLWAINQAFATAPAGNQGIEVTVDVQEVGGGGLMQEIYRVNGALLNINNVRELVDQLDPSPSTDPPRAHAAVVPATSNWELAAYIYVNGSDSPSAGSFDFYALAYIPT